VGLDTQTLTMATEVAVVRQPVCDARRNVIGYELLFAREQRGVLTPAEEAKTTSALLVDAFGDIGLERLAGHHPAWVSIARNFLVEVGTPPVRPDRVVLQIAAYPARDDLLAILQGLGRSGYAIALDGYDGRLDIGELLALCSIVKVHVEGRAPDELRAIVADPVSQGALLVATGVASHEAYEQCRALGFAYFQGEFLATPRLVRGRSVATAGVGALRAVSEITSGAPTFEELERVITADVGLSLKLLRYVNSAFFALPRTIGSVREALMLLGARTVRRWALVMCLSAIPDAPGDLLALALQRGRMCENLATAGDPAEREGYFTVGLLSVADALLDTPMEEVLEQLPFSEEIKAALLHHEGPKGEVLATVIRYERAEFPGVRDEHPQSGPLGVGEAYRSAIEWADEAGRTLA